MEGHLEQTNPSGPDSNNELKSTVTDGSISKFESKGLSVLHTIEDTAHAAAHAAKEKLHLHHVKASGPSRFLNPTTVHFHIRYTDDAGHETSHDEATHNELALLWRSRDNRKGRHSVAVPLKRTKSYHPLAQRLQIKAKGFFANVWRMCSTFPYWDMAFWSGWSYSVGSVLFVIDGVFSWDPLAFPNQEFAGEDTYGVPLCFFFGAIFYQIGATMAYLEAINDGSFAGSGLKRLLAGHELDQKKLLDDRLHAFFGHIVSPHEHNKDEEKAEAIANAVDPNAGWENKDNRDTTDSMFPPGKAPPSRRREGVDLGAPEAGEVAVYSTWRWWPTWDALKRHHLREIGYIACAIQLFGATLYGITGIVVLPGILDSLKPWQELGAYWVPQCVASTCFLTAGILFTLETQPNWWKPEYHTAGWWIGFWATVGSVGFLLSAAFGCASNSSSSAEYESSLSSMWGSAAYLISSLIQWYESVNKGPVLAFPNTNPRPDVVNDDL